MTEDSGHNAQLWKPGVNDPEEGQLCLFWWAPSLGDAPALAQFRDGAWQAQHHCITTRRDPIYWSPVPNHWNVPSWEARNEDVERVEQEPR